MLGSRREQRRARRERAAFGSYISGSSLPSAALRRKLVLNEPLLTHRTFSCLYVALHLLRAGATEYLGTLSSVENQ